MAWSEQRVLARVRRIPEGFVATYADITPGEPRHAGRILAKTHEAVPWWRVVRADGSLAVGARQRTLLEGEGIPFDDHGRVRLGEARLPEEV